MVLHSLRRIPWARDPLSAILPSQRRHIAEKTSTKKRLPKKARAAPVQPAEIAEPPEIDIAAPSVGRYAPTASTANTSNKFPHFQAHEAAVTAKLREMIAVDLAGETAAVRICNAHLSFYPNDEVVQEILAEEENHFNIMDDWARRLSVPVSSLDLLFHGASMLMGGVTALLGKKAVMCCHAAIEEVITEHYNDQLREIVALEGAVTAPAVGEPPESTTKPQLAELRETVKQLRDDEQHHHELGIDHGGRDFVGSSLLYNTVKVACKIGIFLAKRF